MKTLKINLMLGFTLLCLLVVSCGGSSDNNTSGNQGGDRTTQDGDHVYNNVVTNFDEKEVFRLVNNHRMNIGKNPLLWHNAATKESQIHTDNMATGRTRFSHDGFSERIDRIKAYDPMVYKSGENIAQNSSAQRAVSAWLRSYGHRRNIEGDYTHTGIGAIQASDGSWYYTQIFLKK